MSFNVAEEHGSDVAVIPTDFPADTPTQVLTRILERLNAIDARLDVIEEQNSKATEVIAQVGAEVGPIVEKLQGSYLFKALGVK